MIIFTKHYLQPNYPSYSSRTRDSIIYLNLEYGTKSETKHVRHHEDWPFYLQIQESIIITGCSLGGAPGLLWEQKVVNVGHDTTICNCDISKKLAELLIIAYSKLNVAWHNSSLLVVSCCITSQLQNLQSQTNFTVRIIPLFHQENHI